MAVNPNPKQLALDTNLVLDLAAEEDYAHEFNEVYHARGYTLLLPPTAAAEVHGLYRNAETPQKRAQARLALCSLRSWNIHPVELADTSLAVAAEFAERILFRELLPAEERHDARILAETSLAGIPLLVTSDEHLLGIDEDVLLMAFHEAELLAVHAVHPKRLLRALR